MKWLKRLWLLLKAWDKECETNKIDLLDFWNKLSDYKCLNCKKRKCISADTGLCAECEKQ